MTAPPLLGGRYAVAASIGLGGMAEVFQGRDLRLGRDVAIKVLRSELAREPSLQARFRREAQAAASLAAPNIVSVYDTGEHDGVPYIVMELIDGRTLREVLLSEGRLLPQRALEVTADILSALDSAHAAGIVHRDIKPANVMLTGAGEVKVMDFGIARAVAETSSAITQTAMVLGTAAYLSPEQARGEHVDARSDLYSTGCLLYELITGSPPFTGDSPVAVAYQHVRENPQPPSRYDATLSPDIDAVVLKAMAKAPADRYRSAGQMREDLLRCVAGEAVLAGPAALYAGTGAPAVRVSPGRRRPAGRRRTQRRGLVYTTFGLVLLAIMVAVALFVKGLLGTSSGLLATPTLVGLTQQGALSQLAAVGLQVGHLVPRYDDKPFGQVLTQTPEAGLLVNTGGSVDLVISQGAEMTVVPQVLNQSQVQAIAILDNAKLTVAQTVVRDGNIAAGTVLEISPLPGSPVRAHSTVNLVVASGNVGVPDVRGRPQDQAVALLEAAGFSVGLEQRSDPAPTGTVLTQSPVGAPAPRGSVVLLTVAQPPPSPQPSPTGSAPADGAAGGGPAPSSPPPATDPATPGPTASPSP